MDSIAQHSCRNLLLQSMRHEDFLLLTPNLSRVPMTLDSVLATPGQPIGKFCFPEAGIVTFSEILNDGTRIGVGHTGFEGCAGWPALLGCDRAPHEARVTADGGTACVISTEDLLRACRTSESLLNLLLRFVQAFAVQLSRTVVSNVTQSVETRLSRWTLMAHDRISGDEIKVTHEEIAVMLGVRRASVTDALHILEGQGLIRSNRGRVAIRDRAGLQRLAGETYGFAEAEYTRLIAPFGNSR